MPLRPGGGYNGPESSVSEQTENAKELSHSGENITEGGYYKVSAGPYTGSIRINTTETVNIEITGNVTANTDPLFSIENAGTVNIINDGEFEVDCARNHFMFMSCSTAQVNMTGGHYKTSGGTHMIMDFSGTLTMTNVTAQSEKGYTVTSAGKVIINGGSYTRSGATVSGVENGAIGNGGGTMELHDVQVNSTQVAVTNSSGTLTIDGGTYIPGDGYECVRNETATLKIYNGTFSSKSASCIKNNWGQVFIHGGTITSDEKTAVENNGGLRMSDGTVTAPQGTAILFTNISGDAQITGGSIINSVNGIWLQDIGESEVTLKNVTFSGNQNDIHLGEGQKINIKKSFTGCATVLVDDPDEGRQITLESEDVSYQKQLKLTSNNESYRVGYKKENDQEYRMLTTRIGNAVTAVDAVATAEINGEVKELDNTTPVPAGTTVTIKANKAPDGMVFDQWTVTPADLLGDTSFAWKEENTTFVMPDHEITLAAQYRSAEIEDDSDWVGTALIAATAAVGGAVLLYQAHELGTEAYLNRVLPYGEAIPNNRIQLAELLWRDAKCPEAVSTENYRDIDSDSAKEQKAAHWAVESGLVKLQDEETYPNCFDPNAPVTKVDVIRAWKKAQELKETAQ